MKHLSALFTFLLAFGFSFAQGPSKSSLLLQHDAAAAAKAGNTLRLLVKGQPQAIENAVKKHGGRIVHGSGEIFSVEIPATAFENFIAEDAIRRAEGGKRRTQPLNDTMKGINTITPVRNGMSPLPQGYDGSGVIVGLIDSGVDFKHPDFKDTANKTRILYIWDQRATVGPPSPSPFTYGVEWTKAKIDSGLCTHDDLAYYGHGTQVTGIAAGDGSSTTVRDYSGAAPQSDIIMVALDFNGQFSPTAIADAAAYIFDKATALGRPCVINASVGDYYGSHDGQDLQAIMIDNLLAAQNGRSVVGAVGNTGNLPVHLSYNLSNADTNLSWFVAPNSGPLYLQLWADTNNFNAAKMAVGVTQHTPSFSDRARSTFTTIAQNLPGTFYDTLLNGSGQRMGISERHASIQGSAYSMEYIITPDSIANYYWSLELTGSGLFHLWCFDANTNALPSAGVYPRINYYKPFDTTHTMVSSFQCSDRVIVVGNYVNRDSFPGLNSDYTYDSLVTAGDIMWNSSIGPTRDGRIKPDITATGAYIHTTADSSILANYIANAPQYVAPGGYHLIFAGSSASSPVVAGIAALYLQRYPNASWWDVKNAITMCSFTDGFTGSSLPDITWGHGKVDAFNALVGCPLTSHDEMSTLASMNIYPNPAGEFFTVSWKGLNKAATEIVITNVLGQRLESIPITGAQNEVNLRRDKLADGIYFCNLLAAGEIVAVQKLVLK
ncbi:MAG: peptidase S8 and S53 subtilisin kexin sedolisin [Bacteroidetes bacterium]|nr:MAG: peptidase S8 and S53 subtilisin kexin sedolisin [Bacteroidota bacterium]